MWLGLVPIPFQPQLDVLQFNSGTNHSKLAQTPQGKGHGPQQDCPASDTSHIGGFPGHLHFWITGYAFEVFYHLFRFNNLLEWLTELGKYCIYNYNFITENTNQEYLSNKETHRMRSGRECKASVSYPCGVRTCYPPGTLMCSSTRKPHWALHLEFLLSIYYVAMIN